MRYSDTLAPEMKQIFAWTRDKMTPCFALEQTELPFRSAEERVWKHYLQERNEAVVRMIRAPSYAQMLVELEAFRESANSAQGALAVKISLLEKYRKAREDELSHLLVCMLSYSVSRRTSVGLR